MSDTAVAVELTSDLPTGWPGPLTRRRRRRAFAVLACVWLVGAALIATDSSRLVALGVGLWAPGAGFLTTPHWYAVFPALFLFVPGFIRMASKGDHVTPALTWLALAGAAMWMGGPHAMDGASHAMAGPHHRWPVLVLPVALLLLLYKSWADKRRAMRGLKGPSNRATGIATDRTASAVPLTRELSSEDMGVVRWAIDHGLHDTSSWDGYDVRDQYTLRSLRYQLNWMQWSLALAHAEATPAFLGVSGEAQRRLIERMTLSEVWSYWKRENLWGNLRADDDPIARDNIMFSGYLLLMLSSYRAATGDEHFLAEGSLQFGEHRYDEHRVRDAVIKNFESSPYTLFACEPGLVFPLCNSVALAGAAISSPTLMDELWSRFHRGLVEEFTFPDGLIPFFQWTRGGIATYKSRDAANTAVVGSFISVASPGYAMRQVARLGYTSDQLPGSETKPRGGDWGTGKRSHVTELAFIGMLAGAVGDEELRTAALARAAELLDLRTRDGVAAYEAASVTGNGMLALARFSGNGSLRRLVESPRQPGPHLADASYPDVLVHAAHTDGTALHLRLAAGDGAGTHDLTVRGLQPGQEYAMSTGETVSTDARGSTTVSVALSPETHSLTLAPMA